MKSKISRRLVIDASVASSSGGPDAKQPCSTRCRDFLQKTLEVCHRVVMMPALLAEWDEHQSKFAKHWRTIMAKKGKWLLPSTCESPRLRHTIGNLTAPEWSETEVAAMKKDVHLIEASLWSDRIVISLDDTARTNFARACTVVPRIKDVVWRNPATELDLCVWLENGANAEDYMKLGFTPKTKQ
jgi:hypothetical protein